MSGRLSIFVFRILRSRWLASTPRTRGQASLGHLKSEILCQGQFLRSIKGSHHENVGFVGEEGFVIEVFGICVALKNWGQIVEYGPNLPFFLKQIQIWVKGDYMNVHEIVVFTLHLQIFIFYYSGQYQSTFRVMATESKWTWFDLSCFITTLRQNWSTFVCFFRSPPSVAKWRLCRIEIHLPPTQLYFFATERIWFISSFRSFRTVWWSLSVMRFGKSYGEMFACFATQFRVAIIII